MNICAMCGRQSDKPVPQAADLKYRAQFPLCQDCFDHPAKPPDIVRLEDAPEGWKPERIRVSKSSPIVQALVEGLLNSLVGGPDYEPLEDAGPGSGKCETCPERMDCGLLAAWSARRN